MKNKDFISKARNTHGNMYDYSMVEYINHLSPVKIICHKHGVFEQVPSYHLSGNGCQMCSKEKLGNTKEKFVKNFWDAGHYRFVMGR
ncbi:MAG: hypothetical protein GF411_20525 [Candidatus Lokiarchaeota archaeon]|nr:hypothetical protein [Candidatus Lokiarchaeota archaeon]